MGKNSKIPENYQTVMPYLIVKDASKFISFTQEVFGAKEISKVLRDEHTIMHAEIIIGDSIIMLADITDKFSEHTTGLFIYVDDADETFKKAIDAGAIKITEVSDQSYGRSGGVQDPFGNVWWITSLG